MQCPLLLSIFLAVSCLVNTDGAVDRPVDDTSPLVQRNSRLHTGSVIGGEGSKPILPRPPNLTSWDGKPVNIVPPEDTVDQLPRAKKAYDTGRTFMDVVREMQSKWKAHKEQQMKELEPWKYKKHMARKEAHRLKMQPKPSHAVKKMAGAVDHPPMNATQRKALEEEAKIARYGEQILLIVQDLLNHEFDIRFRMQTKLGVLMKVVCKRLNLKESEAKFVHRDRQIREWDTPASFGLADGDIIEVTTPGMQAAKLIKEEEEQKQALVVRLRAKQEKAEQKIKMLKDKRKAKKAKKEALQAARGEKEQDIMAKRMGMCRLSFVMEGRGPVDVRVKRQNWLGGTLDLISKRLGVDRASTVFLHEVAGGKRKPKPINPRDTPDSLNLAWGESITVKVKKA